MDFVLHRAGRFDLLEAKLAEHPDRRDAEVFAKVAAELGVDTVGRRMIVCRAANRYPLGPDVEAVPVQEIG